MNQDLVFTSEHAFKSYCDEHLNLVHLIYKNTVYDVTEFIDDHPGGAAFIYDFQNKDITEIFHSPETHSHSNVALRMLSRYKIGRIQHQEDNSSAIIVENTQENATDIYPLVTDENVQYREFAIDRNKGMVPQILKLNKKQYLHMMHNPIHLSYCRMFDSNLLEKLSKNPWYRIPLIWMPICIILLYFGLTCDYLDHYFADKYLYHTSPDFSLLGVILVFLLGSGLWTGTEYVVHKLLHYNSCLPNNKYVLYIHFLLHGIHHTIPLDTERFVFPPIFGAIVYGVLFPIVTSIFVGNFGRVLVAGMLFGYIANDVVHFYIHRFSPRFDFLKKMKQDHNHHHYEEFKEYDTAMNP